MPGSQKTRRWPSLTLISALWLLIILPSHAQELVRSHGYTPFGELRYARDFTHFEYVNPDAPKGGTLRLFGHGTFDSLNPYVLAGRSPANTPGLFVYGFLETTDTLMMGTLGHNRVGDEARAAYGLIAQEIVYPADMSWISFVLRPEAVFSDGTPISAKDVIFSFELLRDKGHPRYALMFKDVIAAEAISDNEARFYLSDKPQRDMPLVLGELPVLPEHYWSERTFSATLDIPVVSGPYRITSMTPGRQLVLTRNPDYWGKDLPVNRGRYNFDKVVIEFFRDAQVGFEAFKSGGYDIHLDYIAKHWATAYDFPAARSGKVQRAEIPHALPQGSQGFFFNTRRERFADIRVRKALSLLFDFQWTNQAIFNGAYRRSQSWFPNSQNAAAALPHEKELALLAPWREQLPAELFTTPPSLPTTDGSGNIRKQLQQALQLFSQAGWHIRAGKLVHQDSGDPFRIEFLNYHNPGMDRVIMPYLRNLERIGIDARYRSIDPAAYKTRIDTFDFDVMLYVLPQNIYPGAELRDYFHSHSAQLEGSQNFAGIRSPVVDALVEQALAATRVRDHRHAVRALDRVLLWHHYMLPHWYLDYHRLAWWDSFAQPDGPTPYTLGIETWWSKDTP